MMEWEKLLADAVKDGQIRELYLRKIPVLKTTTNWMKVEPLGWVDHQMKHSYYKGALVKLNDKLFFVKDSTITAIQQYVKWNLSRKIMVIPEKKK